MLALFLWAFTLSPQDVQRPLPELAPFLAEFRKTLQSDEKLLSQYTYTETETEISLDSKGNAKKTEKNVYQVTHGTEEREVYRRQIVKNGVPVSEKELEKNDREQRETVEKVKEKRAKRSESRIQESKDKENREEQAILDDLFSMYEIQMLRREALEGRNTILMSFKPRPNYKPKTKEGKTLYHLAGRVWVSESDHQLARLEGEVIDAISIGAGILAKVQKGSSFSFQRRKINDEIWLPVRGEALLNARVLLLKGINIKDIVEYSDHKKYSVETELKFGGEAEGPGKF